MKTQNCTFTERKQDQPIQFEGPSNEIQKGCKVELEQNGVRFIAKITNTQGQTWTGEVTDFPNNDGQKLDSIQVGSTVEFENRHVFRCAA